MSRFTENPDEIVLQDIAMFHLESMNERSLWIGVYTEGDDIYHLNIHADGDRLRYYWSKETPWDLKNQQNGNTFLMVSATSITF